MFLKKCGKKFLKLKLNNSPFLNTIELKFEKNSVSIFITLNPTIATQNVEKFKIAENTPTLFMILPVV